MRQMVAFYKGETSNKIPVSDEYDLLVFLVSSSAKFGSKYFCKILKYAGTGVLAEVAFWGSGAYGGLKYMSEHSGLSGEEIIFIQY
ncbi:hypothetical protein [Clostridium tunisiense]|uniref:hypothetical protein n=1 Tax=Clostridium tunisiense TaxID=219748 RepID=UPI0012FD4EE5|nr:hypothetical protein [Clostridium tunisiense]